MQSQAQAQAVNANIGQAAAMPLMVRLGQYLAPLLLAAADYFAVVAAVCSAAWLRGTFLPGIFSNLTPFHISKIFIFFHNPAALFDLYCRSRPVYQAPALLARSRAIIQGMQLCYPVSHCNHVFF